MPPCRTGLKSSSTRPAPAIGLHCLRPQPGRWARRWPAGRRCRLLLLDVPFESEIEAQFLWALIQQSPQVMITVPAGDASTVSELKKRGVGLQVVEEAKQNDLTHLARYLFSKEPPPERTRTGELVWFSAPGEGRECIEIARRILKEAERGVHFDEMAIVIRSTQHYVGLLEHALARARVPAYFDRGTRRPDPTGRAFLAILSCATDNFSAKRFAEYLSLAQVPSLDDSGKAPSSSWMASRDDVFGVLSERAAGEPDGSDDDDQLATTNINGDQAVVAGSLRAPWKWESLLVESAVIGGSERWTRRLNGLAAEYDLKIRELTSEQPDSPRIPRLERERQNLAHLRAFALPLIEEMSAWPKQAHVGRLDSAPRRICAAGAPAPRIRAARACRSASHGRRGTGEPNRSARRACRSFGSAGSGTARA